MSKNIIIKYILPAAVTFTLLVGGAILAVAVTCGFGEEPPPDITIFAGDDLSLIHI